MGLLKKIRRYKNGYHIKGEKALKINIIYPESDKAWILFKFAQSMLDRLTNLGEDVRMSGKYDSSCDINHYFIPNMYSENESLVANSKTSFMITHIDCINKVNCIRSATDKGALGIAMSLDTRDRLISYGIKPNKVCYINPAQDCQIRPKKISLGFTYRLYNDFRKKNDLIVDICKSVSPDVFRFMIMGSGWDEVIEEIENLGFEVEYYPEFDKDKYNSLFDRMDYYCYFGFDEGSMGYLDALAAGVRTIVTPQGYHLDSGIPIDYPITTKEDIIQSLKTIEKRNVEAKKFVDTWTWERYTLKHLEIWKYMARSARLSEILKNMGEYKDGIFSLMLNSVDETKSIKEFINNV